METEGWAFNRESEDDLLLVLEPAFEDQVCELTGTGQVGRKELSHLDNQVVRRGKAQGPRGCQKEALTHVKTAGLGC